MSVRNRFSERVSVVVDPPIGIGKPNGSRVQQHFRDDCNPSSIIKKYINQGIVPQVKKVRERFGDFDFTENMGDVMQKVATAEQSFGQLPSAIRSEFRNDPAVMMQFISDPKNRDRCIELGIFDKPKEVPKNEQLEVMKEIAANTKKVSNKPVTPEE